MRLASDYIHPAPHGGRCRVRIYLPDTPRDAPVILMTEPGRSRGLGLESCVDRVAAEVVHNHDFSDLLMPVFIEHHEATDEFWLVDFSGDEVVVVGPRRTTRSYGEVERQPLDRATVGARV